MRALAPICLVACTAAPPRPAARPRPPAAPAAPAPAIAPPIDAGRFELAIGGVAVGVETFSITRRADGGYAIDTAAELTAAGQSRVLDGHLATDARWRPIAGRFRDTRDGVTVIDLDGRPLASVRAVAGAAAETVTAPGAVDLYVGDATLAHLAPLCAIAGPAHLIVFPATALALDPAAPAGDLTRRIVDLGGRLLVALYCDRDRLVGVDIPAAGLTAARPEAADRVAAARPLPPAPPPVPDGLRELAREVSVHARGVPHATLACALVVPADHADVTRRARATALPAVVLLSGSGPQDRDERDVGVGGVRIGAARELAFALGLVGVASLRCDDRGTAASTGDFAAATLDTFVADARAMVAALRREPAVDPARVGIAGHSEGGVIAPIVATRDHRLAAIALLAAPGRPLDAVMLDQIARRLRRAGQPDAEIAAALDRHRDAIAAIRAGRALPDTPEAREWQGAEAWLASHLARDPIATARRVRRIPVLIAQGTTDQQVTVADAEALRDAFAAAGNPRVTYRIYAGTNHVLARSTTGDIAEYADPAAAVDAELVADVARFFAGM